MEQVHAFISYVRENSAIVDRLAQDLRKAGIKAWLDRDEIVPGQRWKEVIAEAIAGGAFFVACFSQEMNARRETYMLGELRVAIDRLRNMPDDRIWFIPVLLNPTSIPKLPISDRESLSDINAVALHQDWDLGIRDILQAMRLDDPTSQRARHLEELIAYHPADRRNAIIELVEIAPISPRAVPAFMEALRAHAFDGFRGLRKVAPNITNAVPALVELLHDPDTHMKWRAGIALRYIGESAVGPIKRGLERMDVPTRRIAVAALAAIQPPTDGAMDALQVALADPDRQVRDIATKALGGPP